MTTPLITPIFTVSDINNVFIKIIALHTPKTASVDGESVTISEQTQKNGKKSPEFPSRRAVGEMLFDKFPREHVVDFYLSAVSNFGRFEQANPLFKKWTWKNEATALHIFIQSFFTWTMENRAKRVFNKKKKQPDNKKSTEQQQDTSEMLGAPMVMNEDVVMADETADVEDASSILNASCTIQEVDETKSECNKENTAPTPEKQPVQFTAEQKSLVIRQLISVRFPVSVRIWPTVLESLSLFGQGQISTFVDLVKEMMGVASFGTLDYCLSTALTAKYFLEPSIVIYTLLLGPLKGTVVENFALNRDLEFRANLKQLLLKAEKWVKNGMQSHAQAVKKYGRGNPNVLPFANFSSNVFNLMRELRQNQPVDELIPWGWAYHAVRRSARRYYVEKTWQLEHINDLFHTIICQRPQMKQSIVRLVQNVYKDDEFANRLKKFKPTQHRSKMTKDFMEVDLHADLPGFVSIPHDVQVYVVDTVQKLIFIESELAKCESSNFPVVGLDSEWSAYVAHSKASVFQVSFEKDVYVIDMDSLRKQKRLFTFIERLFLSEKALKIGFQFSEDLVQLRECSKSCKALYEPENLICIGKLVGKLLSKSRELGFDASPYFASFGEENEEVNGENGNESAESRQNEEDMADVAQEIVAKDVENDELDIRLDTNELNISTAVEAMPELTEQDNNNESDSNGAAYDEDASKIGEQADVPNKSSRKGKKKKKSSKQDQQTLSDGFAESIRNMGLSNLCQNMLGKSLDKVEQCSVWDRRPLRASQIRYAALDAYVIIELYKRCEKWASDMGADIMELRKQDQIRANMPLFYGSD